MATDLTQLIANPEMLGLERQRQMAQMLLKQGMATPQGQMIGDRYVPANPLQYIGNLFNVYAGQKGMETLDQKEMALAQALREKKLIETNDIMQSLTGAPEVATELAGPSYQGIAPQAVMPAVQANPQEALAKALKSETGAGNILLPSIIEQVLPKQIPDQIKFKLAKDGGYKGTFNDFINQMTEADKARIELDKQRLGFEGQRVGLEGQRLNLEQQKAAQELVYGKPLTESQAKATAFQSQMIGAENNLKQLEAKGFNPASLQTQSALKVAGGPLNALASPQAQQYKQAQEQWAESYLRFKTGAAATEGEVKRNIETFFPKFGDKPEIIAQKADARAQAERDIGFAAGMGAGRGAQPITPAKSEGGWSVKSVK
jgi:hypothetical protein